MELLPPLLLYAAFTVNPQTAILLGSLAAVLYDSFSGVNFGASLAPYAVSVFLFCAVRPIFFRNQITTQFISGCIFGFMALSFQWVLSGKFMVGWESIWPKVLRLSLLSGILAVLYFIILDRLHRWMGLDPGRFEETL